MENESTDEGGQRVSGVTLLPCGRSRTPSPQGQALFARSGRVGTASTVQGTKGLSRITTRGRRTVRMPSKAHGGAKTDTVQVETTGCQSLADSRTST